MRTVSLSLLVFSFAAACSSSPDDPCKGVTGTCVGVPSGASQEAVQQALLDVKAGGIVAIVAGTFELKTGLSLDVDDATLQGQGMDSTILSFANQTDGAQGLYVTAQHGFTMHDLAVEDTKGDGVKLLGTTKVRISKTRVEWTKGANETNGSYGSYPVQCADVLLDGNVVKGASDSGVYVGQSNMIEVKNNQVSLNVAGIEIENSTNADVHDNTATMNTGGILVFNLPGLQVENGAIPRVFDNQVFENNIHDHKSINLGIISYATTMVPLPNPGNYDQYPTAISIHDNTFAGTSDMPTGPLGALLISALGEIQATGPYIVPDLGWDGVMDPVRTAANGGTYAATDRICISSNGDADFIILAWPLADATKPSLDASQVACTLAPLPAVVIQ